MPEWTTWLGLIITALSCVGSMWVLSLKTTAGLTEALNLIRADIRIATLRLDTFERQIAAFDATQSRVAELLTKLAVQDERMIAQDNRMNMLASRLHDTITAQAALHNQFVLFEMRVKPND